MRITKIPEKYEESRSGYVGGHGLMQRGEKRGRGALPST